MRIVERLVWGLVAATVAMTVLVAAGPTVVALVHAFVWLVLVVGVVAVVWRPVSYVTTPRR
jgi:hypothetical protein